MPTLQQKRMLLKAVQFGFILCEKGGVKPETVAELDLINKMLGNKKDRNAFRIGVAMLAKRYEGYLPLKDRMPKKVSKVPSKKS